MLTAANVGWGDSGAVNRAEETTDDMNNSPATNVHIQSETSAQARRCACLHTVGMVAFAGFVSLGVDVAHVRLVKIQLQSAADASARYAAVGSQTSLAQAKNNAVAAAADNTADGTTVDVDPSRDVDFGTWDSSHKTFTVLTGAQQSNANAVRVWVRRTAARSNAVSLFFGPMVGKSSSDVSVSSIAVYTQPTPTGIIGLNSISNHSNLFVGSYDSHTTTTPTQNSAGSNALMSSNGAISGNGKEQGNAKLGPSGSVSGITVTGSTTYSSTPIAVPGVTMQVVTNPGGVSQAPNLSSGQTVTWPGGTYYFTSLTLANNITINFSGPATIYLDGNASIQDFNTIMAYNGIPGNLKIIQSSGNTFSLHDSNNVYAQLDSPGGALNFAHDHDTWYGSVVAQSITVHDNDNFFYDVQITQPGGVATVQ